MAVQGFEAYPTYIATGTVASISVPVSPDHTRLMICVYGVNDANSKNIFLRFNTDAGTNYAEQRLDSDSSTVSGGRLTSQTKVAIAAYADTDASSAWLATIMVSKPTAGVVARGTVQCSYMQPTNGITGQSLGFEWTNTTDNITAISITASANNFAAGTRVRVLGSRR